MSVSLDNHSIWDETFTPFYHFNKARMDSICNAISCLLNTGLFIFLISHEEIWKSLKSTIVFVSAGSLILNIPQLLFQTWMYINLALGTEPTYSIFLCSFLKHLSMASTSAFQVSPFAVSIYRYGTVVMKKQLSNYLVIYIHTTITIIFNTYGFLSFPFGKYIRNDVCDVFRFNIVCELLRQFSTLFLNLAAIFINCLIFKFVWSYSRESSSLQKRQMQLTRSLLIQSMVPILLALPLLIGSFEIYLDLNMFTQFAATWYVVTYLDPILMPLSSVLGIRKTRKELFSTIFCMKKKTVQPSTTLTLSTKKPDRSTLTVRDDE